MSNLQIAIIAGLTGSVATAILSYIVQQAIERRRRKAKEQRLAFVYLTKISSVLALKRFLDRLFRIFQEFFDDISHSKNWKLSEKLKDKNGAYDIAHSICVLISRTIKDNREKFAKDAEKIIKPLSTIVQRTIEDFSLSPATLAEMPKGAIIAYNDMVRSLYGLKDRIKQWECWLENDDENLITPNEIYNQWFELRTLITSTETLNKALIEKGKVSDSEANSIQENEIEQLKKAFNELYFSRNKLKTAELAIKDLLAEKKTKRPE